MHMYVCIYIYIYIYAVVPMTVHTQTKCTLVQDLCTQACTRSFHSSMRPKTTDKCMHTRHQNHTTLQCSLFETITFMHVYAQNCKDVT